MTDDNPPRLRVRFNISPPSCSSGTPTEPPSPPGPPKPPSEYEKWLDLTSSVPGRQFYYQQFRERERLIEQSDRRRERRKYTLPYDKYVGDLTDNAKNNVKNYWIEQGIWKEGWTTYRMDGHWQHEDEPEPVTEYSPEPEPASGPPTIPQPLLTPWAGESERHVRIRLVTEEQRAAHAKETAASRPYPQFLYQISKEREWLEDEPFTGNMNFNQVAYQNVKESWIKQKIWDPEWTDVPGDTWMHEGLPRSGPPLAILGERKLRAAGDNARSSQGRKRNSGRTAEKTDIVPVVGGQTCVRSGTTGLAGLPEVRRSGRILERRGTNKSTPYDKRSLKAPARQTQRPRKEVAEWLAKFR